MKGAEGLVATLIAGGVEACFANPGTSEMHLVAALDQRPEVRCVLGLFEGVVTGAADGYARMAGKPACALLHLGPGLANGLANLHNASRARVPLITIVGQHARDHLAYDTPLTADIAAIARPYSKWLRTTRTAKNIGRDTAAAVAAARTPPGQIATLIVPADAAWSEGGAVGSLRTPAAAPMPAAKAVDSAARALRSRLPAALLLAGSALHGRGLAAAGRIAAGTGARLLAPYPFTRMERGAGVAGVERVAYVREQAAAQLGGLRHLILVGASAPVCYFAYPGTSSVLTPSECAIATLASAEEDGAGALEALATALSLKRAPGGGEEARRQPAPQGKITLAGLALAVAAALPEEAIVVDESMTSGRGLMAATRGAPRHDWLANTGGSIGIALPLAVGAAIACRERRVLCLTADGSGMYTAQALWTMAREGLKVTTVVFANHAYGVLQREFGNLAVGEPGPRARGLFEIGRPDLDWTLMARGMGVPSRRVESLEAFARALREGFESAGPTLIEVPL